jgi:hypothetical protein
MTPLPFQKAFACLPPSPGVVLRGDRLSYITTALVFACARATSESTCHALLVADHRTNGSVERACDEIFAAYGATFRVARRVWTFENGETVTVVAADEEGLVERLAGQTFSFVGFDNVTEADRGVVAELTSRARSRGGDGDAAPYLRATSSLPVAQRLPPWVAKIFPRAVSPDRNGGVS